MNSVAEMLRNVAINPFIDSDLRDRARFMLCRIDPNVWAEVLFWNRQ